MSFLCFLDGETDRLGRAEFGEVRTKKMGSTPLRAGTLFLRELVLENQTRSSRHEDCPLLLLGCNLLFGRCFLGGFLCDCFLLRRCHALYLLLLLVLDFSDLSPIESIHFITLYFHPSDGRLLYLGFWTIYPY